MRTQCSSNRKKAGELVELKKISVCYTDLTRPNPVGAVLARLFRVNTKKKDH